MFNQHSDYVVASLPMRNMGRKMIDNKRLCKVIKSFVGAGLVQEERGHNYSMKRETEKTPRDGFQGSKLKEPTEILC